MDAINSIFDRIEACGINTEQELLYGYFFLGKKKPYLENLKQKLEQHGYSFIEIRKDGDLFTLHVEKIERNTRESLLAKKQNLVKLAENFGVSYDGFDIGSSDPEKPLVSNENFLKFMGTHDDASMFQLGLKLYDLEIYDKAEIVFKECLEKNINPDIASYKIGNMLSWQGAAEDGIKYLELAVKLNPDYLEAWFNLGAICYDNNFFEASIKYYQQAGKLKPDDEDIIYGIAASQFAIQKYGESLENCKRSLEINAKHQNARALLKMLKGQPGIKNT